MSGWELPECGHLECEESCEGEPELHSCGYVEDTFACKIRHQYLQHGWAKGDH